MRGHDPRSPARPLARLGLLGDLHAEDAALALALQVFADEGVEQVLSVGDIVDGRGSVERCCELLAAAGAAAVRGNHERWLLAGAMRDLPDATRALGLEARAFLAALPATRRLETAAGEILLCHGIGDDDMASVDPNAGRWGGLLKNPPLEALVGSDSPLVVVNGHSHRRLVWSYRRLTVINAGTLFRDHDPCFAVADLAAREVTYFELGPGGRLTRGEPTPIPLPLGARR